MKAFLAGALLACSLGTTAIATPAPAWFERALVGMEIGPTGAQFGFSDPADGRYCSRFDGRELVRQAVAAHSEYVVIWARDGDYAYHDSKLLPKAPGLGSRDPLREAVEEARRLRVPLIAYCVVQQGGHYLKAHPEWEMRGSDGGPLGRFCLNSGYLEAMKQITAEELAYGIDGFHIDMLDQGFGPPYGCWCGACREAFTKEFGHAPPTGVSWDAAWDEMLEFRYRSSARFEQALAAYLKSLNPRATVDFNYHGNPPFSFEVGQRPVQHAGNADFVTGETGVWGFSALGVGLNAEYYRAATPGRPFQVAMQRGVRMYHDQTTRPLHDLRWELTTLLAHGAFVTMVDKTGFEGGLDPVAYERIGAAFAEARALRPHYGHAPVAEVGLYFSSRTRDWLGRENPGRYFQGFMGAHRACVLAHLGFGVVLDENVTAASLGRFPVVCLPNVGILSAPEIATLRAYVEQGGNLLVTGQSGQFGSRGQPLDASDNGFASLIGARVKGRLESNDNWVRFNATGSGEGATPAALLADLRPDWAWLVEGPATVYEPTTARAYGQLLKPQRTTRQREGKEGTVWPMSPDAAVGPAVLVNQVGRGTVLTLAVSPDFAMAGEHPVVEARTLLRNAVRHLNPRPRIEISAPANVETVVTDDPARRTLRVHCIAYNATPQTTPAQNRPFVMPGLIEDAPMFALTIRIRPGCVDARAVNASSTVRRRGDRVEAVVRDLHEVVLLRY